MIIKKVYAKTILSKSKVFDYTINPYVGCEHACIYCYARFMKRFTGHKEEWGSFIDVKINTPKLLQREIKSKKKGRVWISGVCDPYQPAERKYELTRECIKTLLDHSWPITIQTKSSLVLRDAKLIIKSKENEVGLSISTADEKIKELFEPASPPIKRRMNTLNKLHSMGIKTFVMIAPILPNSEKLVTQLKRKVNYILIDKMNYNYANRIYRNNQLEHAKTDRFFNEKKNELAQALRKEGIPHSFLY